MGPGGSPVSGKSEIYFMWLSRYTTLTWPTLPQVLLLIKAARVRVDGKSGQYAGNLSPLGNG